MYKLLFLCVCSLISMKLFAKSSLWEVSSPDGKIKVNVELENNKVFYSVTDQNISILEKSPLSMILASGEILGEHVRVKNIKRNSISEKRIYTPIYTCENISESYNEMIMNFAGDYSIRFRVYNDGIAYRFATNKKNEITVKDEVTQFNFPTKTKVFASYVNKKKITDFESQFFNSFENLYTHVNISELDPRRLIVSPMLAELENGRKLLVTEIDLWEYPGMFLNVSNDQSGVRGVFAPYPKTERQGGHNNLQFLVPEREDFIVKSAGKRQFPWRVLILARQDTDLLTTNTPFLLAEASRIVDTDWIRPGKVAWEWWNNWNVTGVPFKTGVNNATYKKYIDFASKYSIEYVILDEGWAVNKKADLMQVVSEINLKELVKYGAEREIGIILWAGCAALAKDTDKIVNHYAEMGIKGFKVDFFDRDDQKMVDYINSLSEICAKHKMLVDLHGAYKPTGLQRTWPNVINFEGVAGLEQMKWSTKDFDMVTHDVSLPFIRMVNGPMDYTQGAMRNATQREFHPSNSNPMSQGTRCRQLAEYVIFFSPLNMLCDSPTNYDKEPECTTFIAQIPTVWDESIALDGKVGEYVTMARRKGNTWYVGGLTDWNKRTFDIAFSFLSAGEYEAEIFCDGVNADKNAQDFFITKSIITSKDTLTFTTMPGGGFAIKLTKK